jgi:DNA replication initiation complex subunit (GINS family)
MEKSLFEDMLELAKKEKARIEKLIQEINTQLKAEQLKPLTSMGKGGRPRKSKTARAEKKVYEILENSEKPLSPKGIVEKAKDSGVELKSNIVRQILSRGKGTIFISPERALWKLKEKQ